MTNNRRDSNSTRQIFRIVSEEVAYKRYLAVYQRKVEFPDGRLIDWDVVGHPKSKIPNFAVVFPFCTTTQTTTLVQEYCQGLNELKYCFPSGAFDDKHTSILECAQHELDEEAHLNGGEWIPLFTRDNRGIPEGKWISNSFMPFLCINPLINSKPAERDAEEYMNIISNVTMSDLKSYIMTGQLLLPSVQAAVMGLEMLKSKNLIKETLI